VSSGGAPDAVTVNVAGWPTATVSLLGWVVVAGAWPDAKATRRPHCRGRGDGVRSRGRPGDNREGDARRKAEDGQVAPRLSGSRPRRACSSRRSRPRSRNSRRPLGTSPAVASWRARGGSQLVQEFTTKQSEVFLTKMMLDRGAGAVRAEDETMSDDPMVQYAK